MRVTRTLGLVATMVVAILVVWHFESGSVISAASLPTGLTRVNPTDVGFSPERLARLDSIMQRSIDQGTIAGMVTLVARRGHIVQEKAYGWADRENKVPMRTDSLFRLASMTKIITTVAAMQLMEEGRLLVNDPVSKFIPAFANTTVAEPTPGAATPYRVVPAKRKITMHDLLTKTPGISYPSGATRELFEAQGFHQWYFADQKVPMCTMIEKLPSLPFHAQPGEVWMNGYTADVIGCVIEKISGMTLDEFMRKRIFQPLKMTDTYFFVPKEKASRLTVVYAATPDGKIKRADGQWTQGQGDFVDGPRVAFSGGAGLVTTANDYARFLQMMLNGGELEGTRIISPKTVELITSNHIGRLYKRGQLGFGFNVEINIAGGDADRLGSIGDYGWAGAYFPRFVVDPSQDMFSVFLAQLTPYGGASDLHDKFINGVYQALLSPSESRPGQGRASRSTEEAAKNPGGKMLPGGCATDSCAGSADSK